MCTLIPSRDLLQHLSQSFSKCGNPLPDGEPINNPRFLTGSVIIQEGAADLCTAMAISPSAIRSPRSASAAQTCPEPSARGVPQRSGALRSPARLPSFANCRAAGQALHPHDRFTEDADAPSARPSFRASSQSTTQLCARYDWPVRTIHDLLPCECLPRVFWTTSCLIPSHSPPHMSLTILPPCDAISRCTDGLGVHCTVLLSSHACIWILAGLDSTYDA
jgi:hypothetical protein